MPYCVNKKWMNKIKKKTTQENKRGVCWISKRKSQQKKRKETKKQIKNDKKKVKKGLCFKTVNDINTCNTHFIP